MRKISTLLILNVILTWIIGCSSSSTTNPTLFAIAPRNWDFGKLLLSTSKTNDFIVKNQGNSSFDITDISISGSNSTDFAIIAPLVLPDTNHPLVMAGNSNLAITIEFTSQNQTGYKEAVLNIEFSTPNSPFIGKLEAYSIVDILGNETWGNTWGSDDNDVLSGIASDSAGNVYVVGSFLNTIDLNPYDDNDSGTLTDVDSHTSNGDTDCFLSKFDKDGNFLWGLSWGGVQVDRACGVVVDQYDSVYIAGDFEMTVDFDPGNNTYSVSSINNERDGFLCKLDKNGIFQWVRTWGGNQADWVYNCEIDSKDNILIVGKYRKICDFNPGGMTYSYSSNGEGDCYVLKLNSSGGFVWVAAWGGDDPDHATSVAVGADNSVIVGGFFQLTVDFDFGSGTENRTSKGDLDCFVLKITENGNFSWVNTWGSNDSDRTNGVAVDNIGNVYAVGQFVNTCDFDPTGGNNNVTSAGGSDLFISKFDSNGNYIFTYAGGSDSGDIACHVRCDDLNNVFVTGGFKKSWDFNPADDGNPNTSDDVDIVKSYSGEDCYLVKFDETGKYLYTRVFGGAGTDRGYFIAKNSINEIYLGGIFNSKIDLNPEDDSNNTTTTDVDEHQAIGDNDCFIVKLN